MRANALNRLIDGLVEAFAEVWVDRSAKGKYGWRIPPVLFSPYSVGEVSQNDYLMCGPYRSPQEWEDLWEHIQSLGFSETRTELLTFLYLNNRRSVGWFLPTRAPSQFVLRETKTLMFFRALAWYCEWLGFPPEEASGDLFRVALEGKEFSLTTKDVVINGKPVSTELLLKALRNTAVHNQLSFFPQEMGYGWQAAWMQAAKRSGAFTEERDAFLRVLRFNHKFDRFIWRLERCQQN